MGHNSQPCDSSMNHNVPRSSGMVSGQQELPSSLRNPPLRSACHMSLQASFPDRVSALHLRDSSMLMQPRRCRMLYTLFLQIYSPYCCIVHDVFSLAAPKIFSKNSSPSPLDKGKNMIIISLSKKSLWTFSPSCFQNCKIEFCIIILQFCRCGGLWNAKGHPDGFLSHYPSLRNFWLGSFFDSLNAPNFKRQTCEEEE